ncbi:MAG: OmpA family protein [Pseudomonadota bacterium]
MNKLLTVIAAGALVAGCATDDAGTSGGATGTTTTTTGGTAATGPEPGTAEHFIINAGDRVFFDTDRFNIKPEAAATLDRQIAWMGQFGQRAAILEGHADERGTREYNQALGERRASSVFDYMTARGVAQIRLATISYGELRPSVLGSNPAAWAQNRRVVTVIE